MSIEFKRFPFMVIFLASTIAGCASSVDKLPGDKYRGVAAGGGCLPFEFDIAINEGTISGQAMIRGSNYASLWNVTGSVHESGNLTMDTETDDRNISYPYAYWHGKVTEDGLEIWQPSSIVCNPPRSGKLTRR